MLPAGLVAGWGSGISADSELGSLLQESRSANVYDFLTIETERCLHGAQTPKRGASGNPCMTGACHHCKSAANPWLKHIVVHRLCNTQEIIRKEGVTNLAGMLQEQC